MRIQGLQRYVRRTGAAPLLLRALLNYVRNCAGLAGRFRRRRQSAAIENSNTELLRAGAGAVTGDGFPLASETTGVTSLAERYAAALFDLADERRALDEVASDLRDLRAMFRASDDLLLVVRSPVLSREQQAKAVEVVAERAGISRLVRNFLAVVAQNRRLFAILAMIEAFLAQLAARRGEVTARVMAAQPLSESQHQALHDQLQRSVGGRVSIDVHIDPGLIGGIVVQLGSRMVDASIRSKLQRLQLAMKSIA